MTFNSHCETFSSTLSDAPIGSQLAPSGKEDDALNKNSSKDIPLTTTTPPLTPPPTPSSLVSLLHLAPHSEGGWYRETWRTALTFHPEGYAGSRPAATAIYFVLKQREVSRWHRVRSDELWLWQRGAPLDLILGGNGERPNTTATSVVRLGPSIEREEQSLQYLVPGGVWQMAKNVGDDEVLVSCIVAPGFDNQDFSITETQDS